MKRILIVGILLLAAFAGAVGIMFKVVSKTGSSGIEGWIGQQLQSIANSYLNPKLSFTDLDYQYPSTVSLKKLRLTADDPSNPGTTIDIIACDAATLTLAEIPSAGKPVVIERIILDKPLISAVSMNTESRKLVGFTDLIKSGRPATQESHSTSPTTRPRLSEVFQIRLIRINDGTIVYDPRIASTEPMELDQINTTLNVQPSESGWYRLDTAIARKPIFDLVLAGEINLDTFTARGMNVQLAADLAQDKLNYLPPQLQALLKQYEVSGAIAVTLTGDAPIFDPASGTLKTGVKLTSANVTLGEFRIPINKMDLSANLDQRTLHLTDLTIDALHGATTIQGSTVLNDTFDTDLKMTASNLLVQDLLAARVEGEPLKLAGKLNATLEAKAPLKTVMTKLREPSTVVQLPAQWGSGRAELTEGRLVRLPFIHALTAAIGAAARIVSVGQLSTETKDRAKLVFSFESDRANVEEFTYVDKFVAARGMGTVGLDRTLDLKMNAGPVERVQAMLGKQIGGAIAMVTDSLIAYRVTGVIGQPKIQPVIGGGAVGNVGRGVETIGEGIGEGLGNIGRGLGNILKPQEQR